MAKSKGKSNGNGANLGFEAKLWLAADKLRNNMDAAEYKHVVLGLIFLKYISDAFEEHAPSCWPARATTPAPTPKTPTSTAPRTSSGCPRRRAGRISRPTPSSRPSASSSTTPWSPSRRDNPRLKGVLPKDYARPALDKQRLGELIDLIGTIGLGDKANRSKDILGRVYEYFLGQFASAEGQEGRRVLHAACVVRVLVEMLEPYKGRVYDPCCGSGGMFVQSEKFVEAHGGRLGDISIYGQETNPTTWRLAMMNLAIRGIEADFGPEHADSFPPRSAPGPEGRLRPGQSAVQRLRLVPQATTMRAGSSAFRPGATPTSPGCSTSSITSRRNGMAGFVLANGSMSSNQSGEGEIRKAIVEADLVDCMVALPGQLFYTTPIPVCLWFLAKTQAAPTRNAIPRPAQADAVHRRPENGGRSIDRVHRELTDDDIQQIVNTYHAWRGTRRAAKLQGHPGFCKSATTAEIAAHGHVLTPGRYVGAEEVEDDGEPFEEKMPRSWPN